MLNRHRRRTFNTRTLGERLERRDLLAADLAVEVNVHTPSVLAGEPISYTIRVTNQGQDDAPFALIEHEPDPLNAHLEWTRLSQFGPEFELSNLNGTNGLIASAGSGSVSAAGDVNGDGIDDVVISETDRKGDAVYVLFGSTTPVPGGSRDLNRLDGKHGFRIQSPDATVVLGASVSAGDFNGDGLGDVLIGSPLSAGGAGTVYVIFGAEEIGDGGVIDVSELDGSNGFALIGEAESATKDRFEIEGDHAGWSVDNAGDVDGDGFDDILIGSTLSDPRGEERAGASYVVFGGTDLGGLSTQRLSELNGNNGIILEGVAAGDISGGSVAGVGDLNGDGFDDIVIGSQIAQHAGNSEAGKAYVMFGGSDVRGGEARKRLSSFRDGRGFIFSGMATYDRLGTAVGHAGDVNGDGFDDLVVTAQNFNGNDRVYVLFGGPNLDHVVANEINGENGVELRGVHSHHANSSVSSAGDVNGDGVDDLLVGDWTTPDERWFGSTYIVFGGSNFSDNHNIDLQTDLDGTNGLMLAGIAEIESSGSSVSQAGDFNNDGIDDVIVAAPLGDRSYIFFGRRTEVDGSGPISDLMEIPAGTTVTYHVTATSSRSSRDDLLLEASSITTSAFDSDSSNDVAANVVDIIAASSRRRRSRPS